MPEFHQLTFFLNIDAYSCLHHYKYICQKKTINLETSASRAAPAGQAAHFSKPPAAAKLVEPAAPAEPRR